MRKILILLISIFLPYNVFCESINMDWIVDGETYTTTTCNIGDDLILPAAPTKYGYTFQGWVAYTPIEYIESTGTQYIDTGFVPNMAGYKANIQFMLLNNLSSQGLLGFNKEINGSRERMSMGFNTSGQPVFGYSNGNSGYENVGTLSSNQYYDNTYNFINPASVTINGTVVFTRAVGNRANQTNVYLLAVNNAPIQYSKAKLYGAQIYDNNFTLVRDFIPVLDPNGVPCMYDRVTDTFFYNAGTGDFIAGPLIGE